MSDALKGKTAVVTGASRGIGQAMAVGLAEAGANIIGVSKSMPERGGETGEMVRRCGAICTGLIFPNVNQSSN